MIEERKKDREEMEEERKTVNLEWKWRLEEQKCQWEQWMEEMVKEERKKACETGIEEVAGRTKLPVGTKDGQNGEEGSRRGVGVRKERWGEGLGRDGQRKWWSTEG